MQRKSNIYTTFKKEFTSFTFNVLDVDDKNVYLDFKKLKVIKNLRKDVAILKPDKGNGVVLINNIDYYQSLEHLFIDKKKFKQIEKDPTMAQLSTLQNYLRSLLKQGELTEEQYQNYVIKMQELDVPTRYQKSTKLLQCYRNLDQ